MLGAPPAFVLSQDQTLCENGIKTASYKADLIKSSSLNTCVFLKASFPTGFPHIRKPIKTRKIFKGLSCNFLHGKLHAVQFSRYKARPLLSAADLYFSTPFRFCQGFLFPSPEGVTLFKSAPQALLPVLWMGGCLAVPLGSSSTSLPHPPAFVKTFFPPSRFFFDRAAGVVVRVPGCLETALL